MGHTNISTYGMHLAAVLACGPHALLSHRSAAWLWGIWRRPSAPIEVTAPEHRRNSAPIRLHRSGALVEDDRTLVEGIPATAVPRTLLDLAATVRSDRLERAIERSEELRLLDVDAIASLLRRTAGHPGWGRLSSAAELYAPPPFTRSTLERRFLKLVHEAGLPRPATGFNVLGYELDFYWPEKRFAVELDSFATHGTRAAFERDRRRQEDLKLLGVEMIRVTELRLERRPEEIVKRIRRLLESRPATGP